MRAAVCNETGNETLEVADDLTPMALGPTDVLVDIKATGICHTDLHAIHGTVPQEAPFVPGHEGAGIVVEIGPGVTDVAVGDHVVVAWSPPCGKCVYCLDLHQPHLCVMIQFTVGLLPRFVRDGVEIQGFAGTGTFAEQVVIPQEAAIKIDDDVPWDIASLIGCGVTTGVGAAINTAKVRPGSTCVVFGCGGIGMAVIQGCKIAGAAVIVGVDLREDKLEMAKKMGATHACTPDDLPALKAQLTGEANGFDYAFEAIGLPNVVREAFNATRRGGQCTVVGAGDAGANVEFNMFELFFEEKIIQGSYYGSSDVRTEFNRFLRLWKAGRLDLEGMISQRIELDGVNEAIQQMKRGEVIRTVIEF